MVQINSPFIRNKHVLWKVCFWFFYGFYCNMAKTYLVYSTYCTLLCDLFLLVPVSSTYYVSSLHKYKVMIKHLSFSLNPVPFLISSLSVTCISHSALHLVLPRRCRKKFQSQEPLWSWTIWAPVLQATSLCCESSSHLPPRRPPYPHWAVCQRCMSVHRSREGCTSVGIPLGLDWSTGWSGTRLMFMARRSGASLMQLVGRLEKYNGPHSNCFFISVFLIWGVFWWSQGDCVQ